MQERIPFLQKAALCFNYKDFNPANKCAEVEAIGNVVYSDDKCAADKIRIVRELSWAEMLDLCNIGPSNTGVGNSGSDNRGNWNTGDHNIGDQNAGKRNIGNKNTGDHNFGNGCAGKCNMCSYVAGALNTEARFMMFNKPVALVDKAFPHVPDYVREVQYPPADEIVKPDGPRAVEPPDSRKREVWYEAWRRGFEAGMISNRYESLWDTLSLPNFSFSIFETITGISKAMIQEEMRKLPASEFSRLDKLVRKARP